LCGTCEWPIARRVGTVNFHELDWKAVGERTGRSPDAARMLWARAMQRVGGLLKGRVS